MPNASSWASETAPCCSSARLARSTSNGVWSFPSAIVSLLTTPPMMGEGMWPICRRKGRNERGGVARKGRSRGVKPLRGCNVRRPKTSSRGRTFAGLRCPGLRNRGEGPMSSGDEPSGRARLGGSWWSYPSGDKNGGSAPHASAASPRSRGDLAPHRERGAQGEMADAPSRVLDADSPLERRAHEAEELFEAAFEQAPRSGWPSLVSKASGLVEFLRVNRSLCEITGLSESDLVGTNFQAIVHPDDVESELPTTSPLDAHRRHRPVRGRKAPSPR